MYENGSFKTGKNIWSSNQFGLYEYGYNLAHVRQHLVLNICRDSSHTNGRMASLLHKVAVAYGKCLQISPADWSFTIKR